MSQYFPHLTQKHIFCIPVGGHWNIEPERIFAIYAPFSGLQMLAGKRQVEALEKASATSKASDDTIHNTLVALSKDKHLPIDRVQYNTGELYQIDILANNTCNFNCVYCYSAAGRSNAKLSFKQIKPLIDFLFDGSHTPKSPYMIHFSGGGEPLLSLNIIRNTIDYIKLAHAKGNKHPYHLGIVTNGSLLDNETAAYLHDENVEVIVSFEILEELQNKERGSYSQVAVNLDSLIQNGIPFGIRTTFTHESTPYMSDMIETLHQRFPSIHYATFDTVLSADLFRTPQELEAYYNDFLNSYYKARELGRKYGIGVVCLAAEPLSLLRDRTCTGKIVLTPEGKLSACSRVSSPKEKHYDEYEYGYIQNDQLHIDQNRFSTIMNECNIYSQSMCHECYAKWNCGGGCRLFHHSFDEQYEKVRCDFVRKALRRQLIDTLEKSFNKSTGKSLNEFIAQKIQHDEL